MRRLLMTLCVLLAGWTFVTAVEAQHVSVTAQPGAPVFEGTQVLLRVGVTSGAPGTPQGYRLVVQPDGGWPIIQSPSANPGEYAPYPSGGIPQYNWQATPPGTYTIIGVVRYSTGATESGSLTGFVVRPTNPYRLVADPASGATAVRPVKLLAQAVPGQSVPDGLHCLFEAVPASGNRTSMTSPACTSVEMRLGPGTWTLRLVVHRSSNPRRGPTLADTVGVSEIAGYAVTSGAPTATVACPAQCETRGGLCVKGREDVMPCLPGNRCPGGYTCTGGYCKQAPATAGLVIVCGPGRGCPPGMSCQSGQCRAPAPAHQFVFDCKTNADCAPPFVCAGRECRRSCP